MMKTQTMLKIQSQPTMETKMTIKNIYAFLATTQINLRPSHKVIFGIAWIAMTIGLLVAGTSCASVDGNAQIKMRAALANVEKLQAAFNAMNTGDVENMDTNNGVRIGGGGDSITEWILAGVILVFVYFASSITGALVSEKILRPIRKHQERKEEQQLERHEEVQQRLVNRIQVTELKTVAMKPNLN